MISFKIVDACRFVERESKKPGLQIDVELNRLQCHMFLFVSWSRDLV